MKFTHRCQIRFLFVIASLFVSGTHAFSQTPDTFWASRSAGDAIDREDDAQAEIMAAMRALDEVGSLIGDQASERVDIDALLAAANQPAAMPAAPAASKHDIQTAPAAKMAAAAASASPKHDIQTAPAAKTAAAAASASPKHDIQTAPAAKTTAAAAPDAKIAAKAVPTAPKHDIQTAPAAKTAAAAAPAAKTTAAAAPDAKIAAKAVAPTAPKHDIQTAPAAKTAAKAVAPDGTRATAGPQPKTAPQVSASSSLALSYVIDVYKLNGVDLEQLAGNPRPSIGDIYQYAFKNSRVYQTTRPAVGDLAFFHNTFDRNRDGRWNDWHSIAGIVESVGEDDTVSILVYTTKVEKITLNLKYPELKTRKGKTINTQLRPDEGSQIGTTSKLFAGFANLLGDIPSVTVVDNWQPGMKLR